MTRPVAYSYVRFSSKKQGKGSSLHRQTQDTVAGESPDSWCARNGVALDTSLTFRDLGVSAYTGRNVRHGELRAFLDAVRTGRIRPGSYLLVERVDRITRQGVDEGMDIIKAILKAGVSIVTLANGRVYGPKSHKKLRDGLLELQFYLEQAQDYSEALSARVSAAWEGMRKKARERGTLASAKMPPWLEAAGEGDARRAVLVPEKAATVRRIFDLLIAGHGVTRIVRTLIRDGTPPLTRRQAWSRTTVRRIVADRAVLGEYQPRRGRGKASTPDGPPIEDYYPTVISPDTFYKARACLGSRKLRNVPRESQVLNVFSGLLRDARTGKSYVAALRVEKSGDRHHVLVSGSETAGAASFPLPVFERAVLSLLKEVDPRELLPPDGEADEVLALSGEVTALEARIGELEAALEEGGEVASAVKVLRRLEARKKETTSRLAEARLRAASPLGESWGECRGLLAALDDAADPAEAKLRLRAVLRRVVESMWLLVVPRGRSRLVAVQVWFAGGPSCRSYLIAWQPPRANASARQEGRWSARSFASIPGATDLDFRSLGPDQLTDLERALQALPGEHP
jgi:DNA invertase Pin-like site-specific DNA recombinase